VLGVTVWCSAPMQRHCALLRTATCCNSVSHRWTGVQRVTWAKGTVPHGKWIHESERSSLGPACAFLCVCLCVLKTYNVSTLRVCKLKRLPMHSKNVEGSFAQPHLRWHRVRDRERTKAPSTDPNCHGNWAIESSVRLMSLPSLCQVPRRLNLSSPTVEHCQDVFLIELACLLALSPLE